MTPVDAPGEVLNGRRVTFVADGCRDIPGILFDDGKVLYEYSMTDAERAAIASGQNLRLWLWTGGRPQPVALQVVGVAGPERVEG